MAILARKVLPIPITIPGKIYIVYRRQRYSIAILLCHFAFEALLRSFETSLYNGDGTVIDMKLQMNVKVHIWEEPMIDMENIRVICMQDA
jgi:hypothetical protein